jgi:hypothetical protein
MTDGSWALINAAAAVLGLVGIALALLCARRVKVEKIPEAELNPRTERFVGELDHAPWTLVMAYDQRDYHDALRRLGQGPNAPYVRFVPMRANTRHPYLHGIRVQSVFVTEGVQALADEVQVVDILRRAGLTQPLDTFAICEF